MLMPARLPFNFLSIAALGFLGCGLPSAFADIVYDFTTFSYQGALNTEGFSINDTGQIAGSTFNTPGATDLQGLVYDIKTQTFTTIKVPTATITVAAGINDFGQVVGTYLSYPNDVGFLKTGNTFTSLKVPGATDTSTFRIND